MLDKDDLVKRVWPDPVVEQANLTQNVSVLRKLRGERASDRQYIVTIPGRGYRFVARRDGAGGRSRATRRGQRAYQERFEWMVQINVDPAWDFLRADARLIQLLKRLGQG